MRTRGSLALFASSIFASAFLIFLVQPMVGKRIVPWFGGTPAVWSMCLAFYQTALFAGYAYAHALIRFATPRQQLAAHAAVCLVAVLSLPVLPGDAWRPGGTDEPGAAILAMLLANVAVPFAALAATGPLVQAWFSRGFPRRSPYPLYAVSNLGSLLALVGYPFLLEPNLGLQATGRLWSGGFAVTALAVIGCAELARRQAAGRLSHAAETDASGSADPPAIGLPPTARRRALWVGLAACGVVLLMGITSRLCLDLASVPFLWMLPLATYLITFILCFGSGRAYRRAPYAVLLALLLAAPTVVAFVGAEHLPWRSDSVYYHSLRYCLILFAACMLLHGEMVRLRPPPASLTSFYLAVSGGGALGGILVGVVAPRLLNDYYEIEIGLAVGLALLLAACRDDVRGALRRGAPRWHWAAVVPLSVALVVSAHAHNMGEPHPLLYKERTFFGILRVHVSTNGGRQHLLMHGTTLHGVQLRDGPELPTSYYGRHTGIGLALDTREEDRPTSIGVVGLGAGTLAAYGRAGDRFRFYEIDGAVIDLARDPDFFTFLGDSEAEIEVVEGDARISLAADEERGLPPFDYLIVDAYSSDAVPVHLLTREAFALYLARLEDDGLLAMHVSSRHFALEPLIGRLARDAGLVSLAIRSPRLSQHQTGASSWVFLGSDAARLDDLRRRVEHRRRALGLAAGAFLVQPLEDEEIDGAPLWTDDFSDLLAVLQTTTRRRTPVEWPGLRH